MRDKGRCKTCRVLSRTITEREYAESYNMRPLSLKGLSNYHVACGP